MQIRRLFHISRANCSHVKRVDITWDEYVPQFEGNYQGKKGKWCSLACSVFDSCAKKLERISPCRGKQEGIIQFFSRTDSHRTFWARQSSHYYEKGSGLFAVHCGLTLLSSHHVTMRRQTRMLIHAADASKAGYKNIIIRTVDTDVVIISIAMTQNLHINELWIAFGTGSNLRYLAAHEIASRVGPQKATSLPVFHAFTGRDTVSCFSG